MPNSLLPPPHLTNSSQPQDKRRSQRISKLGATFAAVVASRFPSPRNQSIGFYRLRFSGIGIRILLNRLSFHDSWPFDLGAVPIRLEEFYSYPRNGVYSSGPCLTWMIPNTRKNAGFVEVWTLLSSRGFNKLKPFPIGVIHRRLAHGIPRCPARSASQIWCMFYFMWFKCRKVKFCSRLLKPVDTFPVSLFVWPQIATTIKELKFVFG